MFRAKGFAVLALGGLLGAFAVSCTQPSVRPIVGPDGSAMLHVHCGRDQSLCFQLAGQSCPHGYDMSPIFDVSEGNFLVRCRELGATRVVATTTSATPTASTWHPNDDVVPLRPLPAATAARSLPPTPRTASGEVDLGY